LGITNAGQRAGMDTVTGHFLATVGRTCDDARLGEIVVEVKTTDGRMLVGIPEAVPPQAPGERQLDETGYANRVVVGGTDVALAEVEQLTLRRPVAAVEPPGAPPA
jgi:hypothetical protein